MPRVKVESPSKHSPQETFVRIKKLMEQDKDLRKMDPSFACEFNESSLSGTAKGKQFSANLKISGQGPASQVLVEVELPFLLTPIKGVVEGALRKKIEAALA